MIITSEKNEDQRVCFKNCLEKCRIDDYTCQLKCEIECHLTPPALPALLGYVHYLSLFKTFFFLIKTILNIKTVLNGYY